MESLRAELAEFIRKNDYRFRNEVFGPERDSYQCTIDVVTGKKHLKRE
jgi:hypothetical protein